MYVVSIRHIEELQCHSNDISVSSTDLCSVDNRERSIRILFLKFQVWITLSQEILENGEWESTAATLQESSGRLYVPSCLIQQLKTATQVETAPGKFLQPGSVVVFIYNFSL